MEKKVNITYSEANIMANIFLSLYQRNNLKTTQSENY